MLTIYKLRRQIIFFTVHDASCNFPNLGLIKGLQTTTKFNTHFLSNPNLILQYLTCFHKKICKGIGTPWSVSTSSWESFRSADSDILPIKSNKTLHYHIYSFSRRHFQCAECVFGCAYDGPGSVRIHWFCLQSAMIGIRQVLQEHALSWQQHTYTKKVF